MKQLLNSPLNLLVMIAVMSVISLDSVGRADQPRIIKVKGQQAIVQFPQGTTPIVGESLSPGGGGDSGSHSGVGSRDHLISILLGRLGIYTVSDGSSLTVFDVSGLYGWNTQTMEFGPIGRISYASAPGLTNRTLNGGGFFDFNFVPNAVGQVTVYGVGALATFGQQTQTIGGTDQSSSLLDLGLMGFLKWFGLSDHICLRADAGFDMNRSTPASGTATTSTGLLIRGGLTGYF